MFIPYMRPLSQDWRRWLYYLTHRNYYNTGVKNNGETEEYVPKKKEQDKTSEIDLNETEIRDVPYKKIKLMVIKRLTKVRRTMHEKSENFNKR